MSNKALFRDSRLSPKRPSRGCKSRFPFDSPYTDRPFEYAPGLCPVFEERRERLILLSVDEQWTDADADDVATAIGKVMPNFSVA